MESCQEWRISPLFSRELMERSWRQTACFTIAYGDLGGILLISDRVLELRLARRFWFGC
jgi:hypothetical protein